MKRAGRNERDLGCSGGGAVERSRRHLDRRHTLSRECARSARHRLVPLRHRLSVLLPLAWWKGDAWPRRCDWPGTAGLGVLYFALFPILFNASLIFTTAARGSLALSTLPLLTMLVGAALGSEALTARKFVGVLIAMGGVALALLSGLVRRPGRRLARRSPDGRRRALHGVLQHLVATVHPPLRSDSLHGDVDGRWRALPDPGLALARQLCTGCGIRRAAMGRGGSISAPLAPRSPFISGRSRWSGPRRRGSRSR